MPWEDERESQRNALPCLGTKSSRNRHVVVDMQRFLRLTQLAVERQGAASLIRREPDGGEGSRAICANLPQRNDRRSRLH